VRGFFLGVAVAGVLLVGCATATKTPEAAIQDTAQFEEPFDQVWAAIISTLEDEGLRVRSAEKEEGLIRTGFVRFVASQEAIEETAEVSDVLFSTMGAMPRMGYAFTIQARPVGERGTEVRATPHIEVYDYAAGLWKLGRSKGVLEPHFLKLIEDQAKSARVSAEEEGTPVVEAERAEAPAVLPPRRPMSRQRSVKKEAVRPPIGISAEMEGTVGELLDAALAALEERKLPIKSADRANGLIVTKVANFAASRDEIDRVVEVENVVYDDSGRTRIGYAVEVTVGPQGETGTQVRVNTGRIEVLDYMTSTWRRGVSKGIVERQILDSIEANIRPKEVAEAAAGLEPEERAPRDTLPSAPPPKAKKPTEAEAGRSAAFSAPYDRVWAAIVATLEESNAGVKSADAEAGVILTKWVTVAAPRNKIERIVKADNVMYDDTGWTRLGYLLSVNVDRTETGETKVRVETTRIEVYTHATHSWVKASSTGMIEQQVLDEIGAKLGSP